jgi:hypothetical protein
MSLPKIAQRFADAFDGLDEIPSKTLERREVRGATTGRD